VRAGKTIANWDRSSGDHTEYGTVKFEHVEEGTTSPSRSTTSRPLHLVVIDAKRRTTAPPKPASVGEADQRVGEEVRIAGTDHAVNISFRWAR